MTTEKIKNKKAQKNMSWKEDLILRNCLEVTQLENEIIYLEKVRIEIDSLKKNQEEFIKLVTNSLSSIQNINNQRL